MHIRDFDPLHPEVAYLGLPSTARAARLEIQGDWFASQPSLDWASMYRYEGVGIFVPAPSFPGASWEQPDGRIYHVQIWRQRVRKRGNPLYLEALWQPGQEGLRVTLHGLERRPNMKTIEAACRGRELLDMIAQRGPKPGQGYQQTRPWEEVVEAWQWVVDNALREVDKPTMDGLAQALGMDRTYLYEIYSEEQRNSLWALYEQIKRNKR